MYRPSLLVDSDAYNVAENKQMQSIVHQPYNCTWLFHSLIWSSSSSIILTDGRRAIIIILSLSMKNYHHPRTITISQTASHLLQCRMQREKDHYHYKNQQQRKKFEWKFPDGRSFFLSLHLTTSHHHHPRSYTLCQLPRYVLYWSAVVDIEASASLRIVVQIIKFTIRELDDWLYWTELDHVSIYHKTTILRRSLKGVHL